MKTITVKEMKAHWATVEAQVRDGETFEVVNRGKLTVHLLPAKPRPVLKWDDHLATAAGVTSCIPPCSGWFRLDPPRW